MYHGSVLSDQADEELELPGIGKLLALTANDEVNALSARHYVHLFGRQNLYQLSPSRAASEGSSELSSELRARVLGSADLTYQELQRRFGAGAQFTSTPLTDQFGLDDWLSEHGEGAVPLIVMRPTGDVVVSAVGGTLEPRPGDTLIGLTGASAM